MIKRQMTAVSLFSGAGGMDVGIMQADFDVLACVEADPHCCETLRAAATREKRKTLILEDDIRTVEPENLMQFLGLKAGELDLLCGGPPCQAFSQIGKRQCLSICFDKLDLSMFGQFPIAFFACDLEHFTAKVASDDLCICSKRSCQCDC